MKSATRNVSLWDLIVIVSRQDVPTLLEHFDALGILVLDRGVVLPLIEQPKQLEVNSFDQSLLEVGSIEREAASNMTLRVSKRER